MKRITAHSETLEVAAWCNAQGFGDISEIVGGWVWISFAEKPDPETLQAVKSAGFRFSRRRGGWYHRCGVASSRTRRPGHPRDWYGSVPASVAGEDS